jgi:hypothetical protein
MLIQELPNARRCSKYHWLDFGQAIVKVDRRRKASRDQRARQLDEMDESPQRSSTLVRRRGRPPGAAASSSSSSSSRATTATSGVPTPSIGDATLRSAITRLAAPNGGGGGGRAANAGGGANGGGAGGLWQAYDDMSSAVARDAKQSEYQQQSDATARDYAIGSTPLRSSPLKRVRFCEFFFIVLNDDIVAGAIVERRQRAGPIFWQETQNKVNESAWCDTLKSESQKHSSRILDRLLHVDQKRDGLSPVDQSMIVCQSDVPIQAESVYNESKSK